MIEKQHVIKVPFMGLGVNLLFRVDSGFDLKHY
jgi:hypothetical protein